LKQCRHCGELLPEPPDFHYPHWDRLVRALMWGSSLTLIAGMIHPAFAASFAPCLGWSALSFILRGLWGLTWQHIERQMQRVSQWNDAIEAHFKRHGLG
jgi:hypothetical protein